MLERLLLLDAALRAWATTHHAPWADFLMAALSDVGRGGLVWLVIGATAAIRRPQLAAAALAGRAWPSCSRTSPSICVLKPLIARSRPFVAIHDARVVVARPSTYSFPSGHAASAVAGAFVTTLMLPRAARCSGRWPRSSRSRASTWACTIPLDVVCGALVGAAVGVLVTGGRAWYIHPSSAAQHQWRGSSVGRAPD